MHRGTASYIESSRQPDNSETLSSVGLSILNNNYYEIRLTHWDRVTQLCVNNQGQHWFR